MLATIVRHGETEYRQGKVPLELACDLTPEGVKNAIGDEKDNVKGNAHEFVEYVRRNITSGEFCIDSSPYGRALLTAKLWKGVLEEQGLPVKPEIRVVEDLEEVKNFNYNLMLEFVNGGIFSLGNVECQVSRGDSNPEGLSPSEYFRRDMLHKLPQMIRDKLPKELLKVIDSFELALFAEERLDRFLETLDDPYKMHILVTHEGLNGRYVGKITGDPNTAYLDRGKFYVVEKNCKGWNPIHVQDNALKYVRKK